ncbi:MAG: ankyrin repeat domain-containing protein, partial [Desulfobacterales bacterium]
MKKKIAYLRIIAFALILVSNTFECFADYNVEATEKLMKLIHDNLASTQLDQIQLLVEEGADINVANSKSGKTLLWIACQNRHLKTVQFLIKNGSQVDKYANNGA